MRLEDQIAKELDAHGLYYGDVLSDIGSLIAQHQEMKAEIQAREAEEARLKSSLEKYFQIGADYEDDVWQALNALGQNFSGNLAEGIFKLKEERDAARKDAAEKRNFWIEACQREQEVKEEMATVSAERNSLYQVAQSWRKLYVQCGRKLDAALEAAVDLKEGLHFLLDAVAGEQRDPQELERALGKGAPRAVELADALLKKHEDMLVNVFSKGNEALAEEE